MAKYAQVQQIQEERYIPINKGHFDLDTLERTEQFQKNLAHGWEEEYAEYRRLWVELPKYRKLRDYPLLVDMELSSVCNLRCPMCYTITDEFKGKVKRGLMEFDIFKKVIDEIAGKVYALRLSLRGESTLHPKFIDCIAYAKSKGIKEISTLSNGSKFKGEYMHKAVDAGLDWLTISIDGTGERYNKIRKPLTFDGMLEQLKEIQEYKKSKGLVKPVIKVQGVWPAIRPNPSEYYNALAPVTDLVAYNPLIDYLRKDNEIVYEDNFACPQLYQRVVVGSDGRVMLCSNDENGEEIIGDVYEQTIHEIWHGDKMNAKRAVHNKKDGFKCVGICKHCYYPRKAVPNEHAVVNNREIWIENYINRKQEVGQ